MDFQNGISTTDHRSYAPIYINIASLIYGPTGRNLISGSLPFARHLTQGERIAFFPEGTSAPQGALLPFHANLFQAVVQAGAPVLPVAIAYVDADGAPSAAADYIGDMSLWESMLRLLSSEPIVATLVFLPPIDPAGLDRRALAAHAHAAVAKGLARAKKNPPLRAG